MQPSSWLDEILPDVLWAVLLVGALPRADALAIFRRLGNEIAEGDLVLPYGRITHSALAQDASDSLERLVELLCGHVEVASALAPLRLLPELPGYQQWLHRLSPLPDDQSGWAELARAVLACFDHQSEPATDCRWVIVLARTLSRKLNLGSAELLQEVMEYPDRGDLRMVRPFIRSTEMALRSEQPDRGTWSEDFWRACLQRTSCGPFSSYSPLPDGTEVGLTAERLQRLETEIRTAFWQTVTHTRLDAKRDAVFGMTAYAASILREAMRPGMSASIVARSSLRTLVEIAVTLAYLVKKDDASIWQQYRNYGVGRAKLIYMRQEGDESPSFVSFEALEALANEDLWEEFTSIELGHWRGRDLRSIADSTGTKDLYDKYYDWASHHGHAHWGAVRESEFVICMNPLHRFHRVLSDRTLPLGDVMPDLVVVMDRILESARKAYPDVQIEALEGRSLCLEDTDGNAVTHDAEPLDVVSTFEGGTETLLTRGYLPEEVADFSDTAEYLRIHPRDA